MVKSSNFNISTVPTLIAEAQRDSQVLIYVLGGTAYLGDISVSVPAGFRVDVVNSVVGVRLGRGDALYAVSDTSGGISVLQTD